MTELAALLQDLEIRRAINLLNNLTSLLKINHAKNKSLKNWLKILYQDVVGKIFENLKNKKIRAVFLILNLNFQIN